MQAAVVSVKQTCADQCFDIFMHAPVIPAKCHCQRPDAPTRVAMHVAQQLETFWGDNSRESVEILKSDMPFGIVLRQFATLCAANSPGKRNGSAGDRYALSSSVAVLPV